MVSIGFIRIFRIFEKIRKFDDDDDDHSVGVAAGAGDQLNRSCCPPGGRPRSVHSLGSR